MKAYWLKWVDGNLETELRETPVPEPQANQVLVKVRAAGLNRGELMPGYLVDGATGSKRLGAEGAGEIVAVGPEVSEKRVGERVMGRGRGAFAEYMLMDAPEALVMPPNLTWQQAACIPLVFTVVYDMLVAQGQVTRGEWLLVTGVSSGVGVAALQLGKALGLKVIGTSRSRDKLSRLTALGLDAGLQVPGADLPQETARITNGKGVDLVVNTVGGSVFPDCLASLGYEGRLATVGYLDGVLKSEIDLDALHARRLRVFGVSNKFRSTAQRLPMTRGFVRDVVPLFASGRLEPLLDEVFPFDQLPAAKARMEHDLQIGKIVLAVHV